MAICLVWEMQKLKTLKYSFSDQVQIKQSAALQMIHFMAITVMTFFMGRMVMIICRAVTTTTSSTAAMAMISLTVKLAMIAFTWTQAMTH